MKTAIFVEIITILSPVVFTQDDMSCYTISNLRQCMTLNWFGLFGWQVCTGNYCSAD